MDGRTKRVSLDFLGEGWSECFVELRYMRWSDYKRIEEIDAKHQDDFVATMLERIRSVFVTGQVLEDGKPVELTSQMLEEFDVAALTILNNAALGYTDPKE